MDELFDKVAGCYPGARRSERQTRRGEWVCEVWVDCPFCGKGGRHFSFSRAGYHCFLCGAGGSLWALAEYLRLLDDPPPGNAGSCPGRPVHGSTLLPQSPLDRDGYSSLREAEPPWLAQGFELIAEACRHPRRMALWRAYKPISAETIARYQFGVARLPFRRAWGEWYLSADEWLTVPLIEGGAVVGLRGRRLPAARGGPKWISASGTHYTLWNLAGVRRHSLVWVCENYVDAAWLMECCPEWDAVALGGASNWRDDGGMAYGRRSWTQELAERSPRQVVVALDNDLAGQASGAMYHRLLAEWRQAHPGLPDPCPNGPRIVRSLQALGVNVRLFAWPPEAPPKADIGWLLAARQLRWLDS